MWYANTIFGDVVYVDGVGSERPAPGIPAQRRDTRALRCGCKATLIVATWDGAAVTDLAAQAEAEAEAHVAAHMGGGGDGPPQHEAGPGTRSAFIRRLRAEFFQPMLIAEITLPFWLRAERLEASVGDVAAAIEAAAVEAADSVHFDWQKARDVREATERRLTREARELGIAV